MDHDVVPENDETKARKMVRLGDLIAQSKKKKRQNLLAVSVTLEIVVLHHLVARAGVASSVVEACSRGTILSDVEVSIRVVTDRLETDCV